MMLLAGGSADHMLGDAAPLIMQSRFLPRSLAAGGQKARGEDRALRNLGVEEREQGGLRQPHAPLSLTPQHPCLMLTLPGYTRLLFSKLPALGPASDARSLSRFIKDPPVLSTNPWGASDAAPSFRWAPGRLPKADPEQPFHPYIYGASSQVQREARAPHFHTSIYLSQPPTMSEERPGAFP